MAKLFFFIAFLACSAYFVAASNDFDDTDDNDDKTIPICNATEKYVLCPAALCQPQKCSELGYPIACPGIGPNGECPGKPGCICIDGYLRNSRGICVPQKQCPSCGGDRNAISGCGTFCNRCQGPIPCPKICRSNSCECKPNTVYDQNIRKCVPKSKCTPVCGQNEVFSTCTNGGCGPRNCTQIGQPVKCVKLDPSACIKACVCREKYLRAPNGICVPEDQCAAILCPGINRVWDSCAPSCPPSCAQVLGKVVHCPIQTTVCRGGCKCITDFYRNTIGECISKEDCLKCTGPHEYYSCGGYCDNVCATLDKENQTNCPIVNVKCNEKCYCEEGYARDQNNICIPIEDCKKEPTCPNGETYSTCPPTKCDAEYCPRSRDDIQSCPYGVVGCAKPRCVCGFNRHRDRKTGKCIFTSTCPPFPCNGPNEKYQACPSTCPGEQCSDYINNSTCPKYKIGIVVPCKPQCRCNEGDYRNSEGICVTASQCVAETEINSTTNATEAQIQLEQGNIAFTGKFFNEVVKSNPGTSVIISPFSVLVPLGQLGLYASGTSFDEISTALNLKTKNDIRIAFPLLLESYLSQGNVEFKLAQKIWANVQYTLSDAFKNDSKVVFSAEAENVDFSQSQQAADLINAWVEAQTNNRIKNLVDSSVLSADTRLVLTNAIYFKGNWVHQFNPNDTTERDFRVDNSKTIKVQTMYQSGSFKYAESEYLNAQILELPYKGEEFTLVVVLPYDNENSTTLFSERLSVLSEKLRNDTVLTAAVNSLQTEKVQIYLPSIEINTAIDLKDILVKINIKQIFNVSNSGLDGILKLYEPLFVSAAIQKAFIVINEIGSEAAAATAIVVGTTSAIYPPPKIYIFNADHPFLFYLLLKGNPFFCGVYAPQLSI